LTESAKPARPSNNSTKRRLLQPFGVNAYVVTPMKFQDFVEAVKQIGIFSAAINAVPPGSLQHSECVGASGTPDRQDLQA
jgi:hypothetical protein